MKYIISIIFSLIVIPANSVADTIVHETDWVSSKEMNKILNEMDENRLFPCNVEGRVNGISIEYKGSYCPFLINMDYFYSRWGLSESWYQHYKRLYEKENGMTQYSHSEFIDLSNNIVHQATWVLIGQ